MTNRASVLAVLVLSLAACRSKADLVVTGGLVWTGLSSGNPQPGAVAVRGDKILQVGDSAAVAPLIGSRTHVVDARDRKSTRLNSSHGYISYAVFCLKKKK